MRKSKQMLRGAIGAQGDGPPDQQRIDRQMDGGNEARR